MSKIRRYIPFIIIITMLMCGCSGDGSSQSTADVKMWRIGVCSSADHEYDDIIMEGFSDAISDEMPDASVTYTRDYISDQKTGSAIMRGFILDEDDLILTMGDEALTAATESTEELPIVATDIIDIDSGMPNLPEQLSLIIEVTPGIRTVGLIYGKRDTHSVEQIRSLREMLSDAGIGSVIYQIDEDIDKKRIKRICDKCDALFIPAESDLRGAEKKLSKLAAGYGVTTIGGDVILGKSTLVCLCPDYYTIGYNAGKQAADILGRGKYPDGTGTTLNTKDGIKLYNKALAEKMDLTFPKSFHVYDPSDLSSVFSDL